MIALSDAEREELIELVQWARTAELSGELSEDEVGELLEQLGLRLRYPWICDLIFLTSPPLTAEQIVDKAASHQPIAL